MKQHFILAILFSILLTACGGGSDGTTTPTTTGDSDGVENVDFNWPAHVIGYQISFIVEGDDTDSPTGIPVGSEVIYEFSEDGAVQGTNPVSGNVYYPDSYSYSVIGNVATIRLTYSATAYEIYELTATSATTGTFYYTGNAGDSRGEMHNWGRYVILSNGAEKSFIYTPGGNQATFEWVSLPDSAYFRLSQDLEGSTSLKTIQDNIVGNSITTKVSPFEYTYREQPLNSYYVIESCNTDDECTEYNRITASDVLRDVIATFDHTTAVNNAGYAKVIYANIDFSADGQRLFVENADTTKIFQKANTQEGVWGLQETVNVSGVFDANGTRLVNETEVYSYIDGNLTLETNLTVRPENYFIAQEISGDGNTIVLGYRTTTLSRNISELYIFHREEGAWVLQKSLEYPGINTWLQSVVDFSISYDGNTLLIANPISDTDEGEVDIYHRTNNQWVLQQKFAFTGTDKEGMFVSISADGTKAVAVDAPTGLPSTVYLLERDTETGTNWTNSLLLSPDIYHVSRVKISGDGSTFLLGNALEKVYTWGYDFGPNDPQIASNIEGSAEAYKIDYNTRSAAFITKITQKHPISNGGYGRNFAISPQGDAIATVSSLEILYIY